MSSRLFVGNLSFDATVESLRAIFEQVGDVAEVSIITDRMTGQSRGFAFVTMGSSESARKAMSDLNGAELDGRELRVNQAEERRSAGGFGGGGRGGGGSQRGRDQRDHKRRW